jgi:thermitase
MGRTFEMRRFVTLALAAGVLASAAGPLAPASAAGRPDVVDDELLVKFKPGRSSVDRAALHRQAGGREDGEIAGLDVKVVKVARGAARSRLAVYQQSPAVEYAELNGIAYLDWTPSDSYYARQWALHNTGQTGGKPDSDIDAAQAWDKTRGSSVTRIAILDSGINVAHPDLSGKVLESKNFSTSTTSDDLLGHGTHVAGTVAAKTNNSVGTAGVCPNCTLLSGKVSKDDGSVLYSWVVNGILWAAGCETAACSSSPRAKVINLSLGGPSASITLQSAIDKAWSRGAVVACAAGNTNTSAKFYPAAYANCIAVAATDHNDQKASFSNFGSSWVDVAAPGVNILNTARSGGYESWYGTSMATPHVSGLAGLLWSTSSSASSVRSKIEQNADRIAGTGTSWAKGRINACRAVGGVSC